MEQWKERFRPLYSALRKPLPKNVHLLTMETTHGKEEIILRLEHFFEKDENPILSEPVTVNLNNLFTDFYIISIIETNLSANQLLKDKKMLHWNSTSTFEFGNHGNPYDGNLIEEITLGPMEIRTFVLHIRY